jgi:hypothetical protein
MTVARPALLAATGLALHAALALGLAGALPEALRVALALTVLVVLPGAAFVALGAVPPGGAWLAPGWALGFGVAWQGALVLASRAAGLPFTGLSTGSLAATAALWALALWRRSRRPSPPREAPAPDPSGWSGRARLAMVALALAMATGAWHAGRLGTPLGISTDSPDHVGTIRRMLASGDAFPRDAFFKDAGAAGADPRKGLWHPQVALVARLAGVDPLAAWTLLPIVLVPLFVLNAAVFGFLLRGPPGAAVAGWAYLLTYGGSLAEQYVREAVFATKLGDQLALATAAAVLADLRRPSRGLRWAAVGLALGAYAAHVYYAIQFAMVFAALGAGLLIADRGWSARARRLTGTALALGLAGLPYLAWRWTQSYAPSNTIHTETQGLLYLADGVPIVSFGVLWDWLGHAWVLFPLAAPWLWRAGRHDAAALYLLTTPVAIALVIFDPPAVTLLEPRLGYLLMRMVWMAPLAPLLAWLLPGLGAAVRRGPGRARSALALGGIMVIVAPMLQDAAGVLAHPGRVAEQERRHGVTPWADALAWMDRSLPPGSVILSDPATSYSVPMHTRHYVMTLSDQHSSPNDPLALTRIMDARDALEPHATWSRVREVVARYGVDAVALNGRFPEPPSLDYWKPTPEWFAAARARLDGVPGAFERVFDTGDFVVYRVRRAALDTLAVPVPPRPYVLPWEPGTWSPGRAVDPGLPALCRFALARREAAHGDTVVGIAHWRAPAPLRQASYFVALRFDRPLPDGFRPPAAVGKPARKLIERLRGERYRFRADHLPVGGAYGVDLWRPDQVVRDSFAFVVPGDVAVGVYQVRVRMISHPHYPNVHLRDYLEEDDYLSGLKVGTLTVTRRARNGRS